MYINVSYNSFLLRCYQVRFDGKPLICEDKYPENSAFQDSGDIHSTTIIVILSSYHQVKLTPKAVLNASLDVPCRPLFEHVRNFYMLIFYRVLHPHKYCGYALLNLESFLPCQIVK